MMLPFDTYEYKSEKDASLLKKELLVLRGYSGSPYEAKRIKVLFSLVSSYKFIRAIAQV